MLHSESITKLAAALVKVQSEIENAKKSANNPFFGSKYADLAEIIETARPVLSKYGLAIVQLPGFTDGVVTLDNVLLHESGEWISGMSGAPLPVMTKKNGEVLPPSPQGVGSAITYLRRYSLAAMCMIAQEDDDGNAASHPKAQVQPMTIPATPARTDAIPAQNDPDKIPESWKPPAQKSARDDFDVYSTIGKGEHKLMTWHALAESGEKGRSYIKYALDKWTTLAPNERTGLTALLDSFKGSPVDAVLLQNSLNTAAAVGAIDVDQAARIEDVISENDADHMSAARDWLETMIQKKKLVGI